MSPARSNIARRPPGNIRPALAQRTRQEFEALHLETSGGVSTSTFVNQSDLAELTGQLSARLPSIILSNYTTLALGPNDNIILSPASFLNWKRRMVIVTGIVLASVSSGANYIFGGGNEKEIAECAIGASNYGKRAFSANSFFSCDGVNLTVGTLSSLDLPYVRGADLYVGATNYLTELVIFCYTDGSLHAAANVSAPCNLAWNLVVSYTEALP